VGNEFIAGEGTTLLIACRSGAQELAMDEPVQELGGVLDRAARAGATQVAKSVLWNSATPGQHDPPSEGGSELFPSAQVPL
jgi:hypothetical protein